MVLTEENLTEFPVFDANYDLIAANTELTEESLRLSKKDDQIDEQYQIFLYDLLISKKIPFQKENYATKENNKLKSKEDIDIYDNGEENDPQHEEFFKHFKKRDNGEENDTQHEEFFKHFKKRNKARVLVYDKDGSSVVVEYEGEKVSKPSSAHNGALKRKYETSNRKEHSGKFLDRKMKSSFKKNNIEENKEGKGLSDSDVEILDEAPWMWKGKSNPFVSSKKFPKSKMKNGIIECIGRSSVYDEFRGGVLNVLKKPYDKEEYTRHLEAIQAGKYFDYHPDLQKKLKQYRYNRRKRLNILCGFFFWLQNLTQEGAFKPWKDGACLAVEPPEV